MSLTAAEWNDFYLPPRVGSLQAAENSVVASAPAKITELSAGDVDAAILTLQLATPSGAATRLALVYGPVGDDNPLHWYTILQLTVKNGFLHYLPLSAMGPALSIWAFEATATPFTLAWKYVTRSGTPDSLSIVGSSPSAQWNGTLMASESRNISPAVVTPGRVSLYLTTTATDYDVFLKVFDGADELSYLLLDETMTYTPGFEFNVPASSWGITVTNNDATDQTFDVMLTYR